MLHDQPCQRRQRSLPVVARLERINGRGLQQLAGRIDDRHLAAGADAGVEAEHGLRTCRRRQQQLVQIAAENLDRLGFRCFAQLHQQLHREMQVHFDPPGPIADPHEPRVCAAAAVFDPDMRRDHRDAGMRHSGFDCFAQVKLDLQHTERAAAEQRQRAMRRNGANGFSKQYVLFLWPTWFSYVLA